MSILRLILSQSRLRRNSSSVTTFMPSIAYRSKIRAVSDHCSLTLGVRHHLVTGIPSDKVYSSPKTRFPDNVDVLLASNLVIRISGIFNGSEVSADEILASSLSLHLLDYLRTNAVELGLNTVSELYIDDEDGLLKLILTSSRQMPDMTPIPVVLVALDLCYAWQTSTSSKSLLSLSNRLSETSHPFSRRLSLPFRTVLDNVVGRFVTWQLVKRYPFIFGPWCQQLDIEASYFPGIFCSIFNVMERSPNTAFRAKCRRLIKILRYRHSTAISNTLRSLSAYLTSVGEESTLVHKTNQEEQNDEDILCLAMERVYRNGLSRPQFKGHNYASTPERTDDDDLSHDHSLLSSASEHVSQFDDHSLWNEPPKAISPRSKSPSFDSLFSLNAHPELLTSCQWPMDIELEHCDEELPGNDVWSDYSDFDLDNACDTGRRHAHLINPMDFQDAYLITSQPVEECAEYDQPGTSTPLRIAPEVHAAESNLQFFCGSDHAASQTDQSFQDVVHEELGIESRSQAGTSLASLRSPTITGPSMFHQKENDSLGPLGPLGCTLEPSALAKTRPSLQQPAEGWEDICTSDDGRSFRLFASQDPLGDELDLSILSDTDSSISTFMETGFEKNRDLEVVDGASVALTRRNSHHAITLMVTCPFKADDSGNQLRRQEEREKELNEGEKDVKCANHMDMEHSSTRIEDWDEDVLFVMDF